MRAPADRRIPFYYWPLWMVLLALGLLVFYVFLTPVWMVVRLVAWLSERGGTALDRARTARRA